MLEDLGIWMVDSAPTPEAVRAHRDEAQREREATRIRREGETETPESRLLAARVPLAEPELVLRIAAEGGGLTLIRQRIDGGWRFRRTTSDQSLWTTGEAPSPLTRTSPWVATWDAAVQLLDRYPWVSLAPLVVHREYRAAVLQAVRERLSAPRRSISERAMQQWESACAPEADGTFSPGA